MHGRIGKARRPQPKGILALSALGILLSCGLSGHGFNLLLQLFFGVFVEARELDAHPDSAIASPDNRRGVDWLRIQPEGDVQDFSHGQGQHGLDITATAVDVCRLGSHVRPHTLLIPDLNGKGDPLSREISLVLRSWRGSGDRVSPSGWRGIQFLLPGARLPLEHFDAHIDLLRRSGIHHPYHLAARFFVAKLHSDNVPGLELSFQSRELGAMIADVSGMSVLGKWTTVRVHSKDSDREVHVNPGFWLVGHAIRRRLLL